MPTMAVEYEPAFIQTVNLHAERCTGCHQRLCLTPNSGQQVGSIGRGWAGLPEIALYHYECAPESLRAANRQDEIAEFTNMMQEDETVGEVETCAYQTWRGSNNPDHPEPPEYCDEDVEPGSEYCKAHEGAGEEY